MMGKSKLRESMLAKRGSMHPSDMERIGEKIQRRVVASDLFAVAKSIGSYIRLGKEVPTDTIHQAALAGEKMLAVPFRRPAQDRYYFARLEADSKLEKGAYGVLQPVGTPKVAVADINLILVPGVAFSRRGDRLGRGGAVYDRLLGAAGAAKVGLCYGFQIEEDISCESHDQRVDWIATENEFFRVECNMK